jgi:hypothetical protein
MLQVFEEKKNPRVRMKSVRTYISDRKIHHHRRGCTTRNGMSDLEVYKKRLISISTRDGLF